MLERDDKDSPPDERSLLSLAERLRTESAPPNSRLKDAVAQARAERPPTRDRLARSRRAAQKTPLLAALEKARQEDTSEHPTSWSQRASNWLGKLTWRSEAASASRARPEAAAVQEWEARKEQGAIGRASWTAKARISRTVEDDRWRDTREFGRETSASALHDGNIGEAGPRLPLEPGLRPEAPSPHPHSPQRTPLPSPRGGTKFSEYEIPAAPGGIWQPLIDPATVLRGIVRSRLLILATTVAGALIGVLVALNTPKQYYAAAELLADPRDLNLVERELTQSGISNEATLAIVENQVRILTSGTVISKVIDRLNLAQDPEFNGQGGGLSLRGLFSSLLSGSAGKDDPGRRYALAATNLHEKLSVQRGGKTFVIGVGVTTEDPEKSALIANTMTDVFLESYGQLQSNAAGRAATELNSKLDELRAGVEAAERKVESFKAENDLIDAQGRLITDDEILKLNDQLATARAHTLELNARAASARSASANDVLTGSLPEELASPSMQELRAQYSALKGEVDRLSVRLGPRHPQLQALQSQLAGARSLIEAEIRRITGSIQTELKRAVQLEQELSSRLAQLKVRQGNLSNEMVTLRELERDATAKRAVYEAFLLRARETGEQQGINSANISVISKAHPPLESEPPSRSTIVLVGTLLGLLAGLGLGVVRGTAAGLSERLTGSGGAPILRRRRTVTMFDQEDAVETAGPSIAESADGHRPDPLGSASMSDRYPYSKNYHGASYASPPAAAAGEPRIYPHPAAVPHRPPAASRPAPETQPAARSQDVSEDSETQPTIEEIRSSLQECREAIRDLAQQRLRRRYF